MNRDAHQQGQPPDNTMNINNHPINFNSSPPHASDHNHVQNTTMDMNIQIENQKEQEEKEEEIDDDDIDNEDDVDEDDIDEDDVDEDDFDAVVDDKTIAGHESNDNDHDSIYQTPPTSDDNEDNNLD
jgi:hypothetical protein